MQHEIEDARILDLILDKGNPDAGFRLLMDKYQERLYWHIRRLVRHHQDADDVLQNTFVKVYGNLESFRGHAQLFTWMYRIATNEAITFMKQRSRRNTDGLEGHAIQLTAEAYLDPDEVLQLLTEAMGTLPEKQLLVFSMRYFDELTYQEMSDELGTSVGGLKASFHHAVKKIRQYLETKGYKG